MTNKLLNIIKGSYPLHEIDPTELDLPLHRRL